MGRRSKFSLHRNNEVAESGDQRGPHHHFVVTTSTLGAYAHTHTHTRRFINTHASTLLDVRGGAQAAMIINVGRGAIVGVSRKLAKANDKKQRTLSSASLFIFFLCKI